jgi:para-nitrobenzyl esterase
MEHGITPSTLAARLVLDGAPEATQGAVAAGLLAVGSRFLGTVEQSAELLQRIVSTQPRQREGPIPPVETWCERIVFDSAVSPTEKVVNGTGLLAEELVAKFREGRTDEELLNAHPELTAESRERASGNYGMLDLVAALGWVRRNIAAFGGDPGNVTIFGQSGGAGKVSTLLAMPGAKGLFHRAIIQSGSALRATPRDRASKSAEALFAKLGMRPNQVEDLQKLTLSTLLNAARGTQGLALSPVLDPRTLPADQFDPNAPAMSADIPLLAGTVETEVTFFPNTQLEPIDDAGLRAAVKQNTRANDGKADELIGLYRKGRPGIGNTELLQILSSDNQFRNGVLTVAERKAAQRAPVYMYYFNWRSPVREGKLRTFHTLEIPFVFQNIDESKPMTGFGEDRYALADRMSAAWAAFARNGNPNAKGLPSWTPFKADTRATMILGNDCHLVNDPNREERLALAALRTQA